MSSTTIRVLEAFLSEPGTERYGYELLKTAGIKSGSLYPILDRLESAQWIVGEWRESNHAGRPRRRSYKLTGLGQREAKLAIAKSAALVPQIRIL